MSTTQHSLSEQPETQLRTWSALLPLAWIVYLSSLFLPSGGDVRGMDAAYLTLASALASPTKNWYPGALFSANIPVVLSLLLLRKTWRRRVAAVLLPLSLAGLIAAASAISVWGREVPLGVAYDVWLASLALLALACLDIVLTARGVSPSIQRARNVWVAVGISAALVAFLIGWGRWREPRTSQALLEAVSRGDVSAADTALRSGVSVETTEVWGFHRGPGRSLLTRAAERGDDGMVELLLHYRADVNRPDGHGDPAILAAASAGRLSTVRLLLDRGANPLARRNGTTYRDASTALHAAARIADRDLIALLLEAGVPVDSADRFGYTPLHSAAIAGNAKAVQYLLERGADRNKETINGDTPLEEVQRWMAQMLRGYAESTNQDHVPEEEYAPDIQRYRAVARLLGAQ